MRSSVFFFKRREPGGQLRVSADFLSEIRPPVKKSGTRPTARALGNRRGTGGGRMWLALAAITLAGAIGFSVFALAIQFER